MKNKDLTSGPVGKKLLLFSLPIIAGNLLQQLSVDLFVLSY